MFEGNFSVDGEIFGTTLKSIRERRKDELVSLVPFFSFFREAADDRVVCGVIFEHLFTSYDFSKWPGLLKKSLKF